MQLLKYWYVMLKRKFRKVKRYSELYFCEIKDDKGSRVRILTKIHENAHYCFFRDPLTGHEYYENVSGKQVVRSKPVNKENLTILEIRRLQRELDGREFN